LAVAGRLRHRFRADGDSVFGHDKRAFPQPVPGLVFQVGGCVGQIAHQCGSIRAPTIRGESKMNRVPDDALTKVPGGSLITETPEQGRALALDIARHTIHNIQPDLDVLQGGRPNYSTTPESLIAAAQVVALEFQTIAAANDYWRK
jgi:hypothetical protein